MNLYDFTGQTLGQYELREVLGRGGMGTVYRAYQPALKREVAVKLLMPDVMSDTSSVARFTREAQVAASLEHPHIVSIYDYGTADNISYVVMRLLLGGTLNDWIQTHPPTEISHYKAALQYLLQLADALDYAHSRSVTHRDIKPGNIMFDVHGRPYLVDFGLAKLMNAVTAVTGSGQVMGTPAYMAPELWIGKPATPAADQYAFGVVAYQMFTGQQPIVADVPYAFVFKHLNDIPPAATSINPMLPETINHVFWRVLAKSPQDRYPNSTIFVQELEAALKSAGQPEMVGRVTNAYAVPLDMQTVQLGDAEALIAASQPQPSAPATSAASNMTQPNAPQHTAAQPAAPVVRQTPLNIPVPPPPPQVVVIPQPSAPTKPPTETRPIIPATAITRRWLWTVASLMFGGIVLGITAFSVFNLLNADSQGLGRVLGWVASATPTPTATYTATPTHTLTHTPTATVTDTLIPTETLTPTLEITPNAQTLLQLGQAAADVGDVSLAVNYYTAAIMLDPSQVEAYAARGWLYLLQYADYGKALTDFSALLALAPSRADAHYGRGLTYAGLEDYAAAITDYTAALQKGSDNVDIYVARAESYLALGDTDSAIADFNIIVMTLDENYAYAYQRLGDLYYSQGDSANALANYTVYRDLSLQNNLEIEQYTLDRIIELKS